jgi:hypothetical protein
LKCSLGPFAVAEGFYDTVRLFCFFLRRSASAADWSCAVLVTGFLESGRPCVAHVTVSPERNRVSFFNIEEHGRVVQAGGSPEARRFLLQGIALARAERKQLVPTGFPSSRTWVTDSLTKPAFRDSVAAFRVTARARSLAPAR